MKEPRMIDEKLLVAWNAAYWMMRSEARRQQSARFPDCNWKAVEADDDWIATVVTAQAEVCLAAMRGMKAGLPLSLRPPIAPPPAAHGLG